MYSLIIVVILNFTCNYMCVVIATKPMHRLQIRPIVHNYRGHPLPFLQVTSGSVQYCGNAATGEGQTDTQIHRRLWPRYIFASAMPHSKCNYCPFLCRLNCIKYFCSSAFMHSRIFCRIFWRSPYVYCLS